MLGDLCLNGLGIIQTGPFGSQLHASDYKSAGIPVVNPTHLRFNSIVDDAIPRISREKADSLYKHYLMEGDILISRRGDFSRYSYISQKYSDWFCGTGCLLIRLTHPEVDNYFLSILFSTEVIQNYLKLNAVGSIMPNLNTRILQDVPLTLPKIEQQREIAEVLRSCDRKITALEQEAVFLDELFRAMLEELMTGRLSALPLVEEKALN
jgi:type I restriction enzyme S subunit